MNLQQLQYFLASIDRGSFSAAADTLGLAQPSVSEQVRRLEAELGVALFQRVGRGLVPTQAAVTLRPHAERVLAEVDAARSAVAQERGLHGGLAAFGTWGSARHYPGTEIVAEFRRRHPSVRVRLRGQNSSETAELVRRGQLEAGMVALPVDDAGLEVEPIMHDELFFVSTVASRLRSPMTIERLAGLSLVLPEASFGTEDPTRRQLSELGQRAGVRIEPDIDVEDVESAVELAGEGLADTILAKGMLHGLRERLPATLGWAPFAEPLHETIAFVTRRGAPLSPATRELLGIARERLGAHALLLEREPRRRAPKQAGGAG